METEIISLIKKLYEHLYIIKIAADKNPQKIKYIDSEPMNSNSSVRLFKFFLNGVILNNASKIITNEIILTITVVIYKKKSEIPDT